MGVEGGDLLADEVVDLGGGQASGGNLGRIILPPRRGIKNWKVYFMRNVKRWGLGPGYRAMSRGLSKRI